MGRTAEAKVALKQSLAIWQKLAEANPSNHRVQYLYSQCFNDIGELLTLLGKPGEGLQLQQKARALQQKQADEFPAYHPDFAQDIVANSLEKASRLLSASGRTEKALAACREALVIRQKLSDTQAATTWFKGELAKSRSRQSTAITWPRTPAIPA